MLKECKEEELAQICDVGYDRLKPEAITAFFWVTFTIGALMTFFISDTVSYSVNITNPIWLLIIKANALILVVHFLLCIIFTNKKVAYRLQRLQVVLLCILGLKLSFEFYPFYFTAVEDRSAPGFMNTIGLFFLFGGVVYLVISTVRAIGRVEKGELRENGKGLYDFKASKIYISLPIVFGITMLGGAIAQLLSSSLSTFAEMVGLLFVLLVTVVIQYAIMMAWPEFFLLAYGKFRFTSFRLPLKTNGISKSVMKTGSKKLRR